MYIYIYVCVYIQGQHKRVLKLRHSSHEYRWGSVRVVGPPPPTRVVAVHSCVTLVSPVLLTLGRGWTFHCTHPSPRNWVMPRQALLLLLSSHPTPASRRRCWPAQEGNVKGCALMLSETDRLPQQHVCSRGSKMPGCPSEPLPQQQCNRCAEIKSKRDAAGTPGHS